VADASHQLRTPLTALRLSLDNIADGVDDEFVQEDVEQATAEVVRMNRLVNGLLVLARAEAKDTASEPLPLRELVAERLAVWRPAADERGVTVVLGGDVDGRLLMLAGPGHLDQVLDNVLSNALEVSPDGGAITVRVGPRGDEVMLSVLDEGPGMTDAEKSRAFDRFWRGQGLTGRSGSGLGLAVVKQLVTDDGGTVVLRDAPGAGLFVAISLRASFAAGVTPDSWSAVQGPCNGRTGAGSGHAKALDCRRAGRRGGDGDGRAAGRPATGGMASTRARGWVTSLTLAAVVMTLRGDRVRRRSGVFAARLAPTDRRQTGVGTPFFARTWEPSTHALDQSSSPAAFSPASGMRCS
jgi:hypothetical protein